VRTTEKDGKKKFLQQVNGHNPDISTPIRDSSNIGKVTQLGTIYHQPNVRHEGEVKQQSEQKPNHCYLVHCGAPAPLSSAV